MTDHAIIHGDLDSLTSEDYGENVIPVRVEPPFVQNLAVLLSFLRANPSLADTVYLITNSAAALNVRVITDENVTVLQLWASYLTEVSSSAHRYTGGVDGEVHGLLDGAHVSIVGIIPDDSVPAEAGDHEWTLEVES